MSLLEHIPNSINFETNFYLKDIYDKNKNDFLQNLL